jgi:hypothetical protein
MSWIRRLAVGAGLAVVAAGIAVPLSLSTSPAAASTEAPLSSVSSFLTSDTAAPDASARRMPAQLRKDLRAAWGAPDGKRVAALQAVLAKAVAGEYGTQVQNRAKRLQHRLDAMNQTLRADLQRAVDLPKDQRQAALKQIRQKIRAGDYGDQVRRQARMLHRLHHQMHHRGLFG